MSEEEIDRKITVIFATDVVGYSKHMEARKELELATSRPVYRLD